MDDDAPSESVAAATYVSCSECARLIDHAQGNCLQRHVERLNLLRHYAEEHKTWLDMPDIAES